MQDKVNFEAKLTKSEFSFSSIGRHTKVKLLSLPYYKPSSGYRIVGIMPFLRLLTLWEM